MEKGVQGLATTRSHKRRLVLVAATVGMALAALDLDLPAAALPKIVAQLDGVSLLGWVFTTYLISSVLGMLIFGSQSDSYGRKPLFLLGIGLFMLGCLLATFAPTMSVFLLCRALQGLGAGALPPLAMAIAADLIADEGQLGRTQGMMNSVWGISGALGPLVGGTITDSFSWRGIFLFILPIAAVAMGLVITSFQELRPPGLDSTGRHGHPEPSGRQGWFFLLSPSVLSGFIASLLFGAVILLFFAYLPLFVQGVMRLGARESGIVLASLSISWTSSGIAAGVLMKRFASASATALIMFVGVVLMVCAWMGLLSLLRLNTPFIALVPAALLLGWGGGLFNTPSVVVVPRLCPAGRRGLANALVEVSFSTGAAVGVFAAGLIFQSRMGSSADAVGGTLLGAHARGQLSPRQSQLLTALLASGLHGVYIFAGILTWGLLCAVTVLALSYASRKPKGPKLSTES